MLPLAPVHTVGLSAYVGITIAAALEGEITFVGAAALVSQGMLDPVAVIASGAMGAALGDQFYFYAFRGSFSGHKTRSRDSGGRPPHTRRPEIPQPRLSVR